GRGADGRYRPGQEGQGRKAHLHPDARHRPVLRRRRRAAIRSPRLPEGEAVGMNGAVPVATGYWLFLPLVAGLLVGLVFLLRWRDARRTQAPETESDRRPGPSQADASRAERIGNALDLSAL